MLFTSPIFLFVFLPLFLTIYHGSPRGTTTRNAVALAGSAVFFAWGEPVFVFALIAGTYVDYRISRWIEPGSAMPPATKKRLLTFGIVIDVAALVASKYLDFIVGELAAPLANFLHLELTKPNLPLLLGISFITFHRISYLVDSYKGRAVPPRGFMDCALYIFLFPQLIAGPIIRYHDIGAQIHHRDHTVEGFLTGVYRFSIGLAKKTLLADPLGIVADKVFGMDAATLPAAFAWGGIVAYSLQIYFDFSGYSDMALGLGRTMGFRFPENFNRPYIARSVTDFWRRWHISLSNWMRLYLYIPMGGNRGGPVRTYLNLWVVFLISGFWHGADWTFIVWGAYYGFFLCAEKLFADGRLRSFALPSPLRPPVTMLIVMVGWVFFRSTSVGHAVGYIESMLFLHEDAAAAAPPWGLIFGNRDLATMALGVALSCVTLPGVGPLRGLGSAWNASMTVVGTRPMVVQFAATMVLLVVAVSSIVSSGYAPFLYFRF
jgi:alginate O-acetyltransferase complex protein AlgI